MDVTEVKANDVIAICRRTTGLREISDQAIDQELIATLLRRAAGILCPCSSATLRNSLAESLQYLDRNPEPLVDRVDEVISSLIVGGDLLEVHEVASHDASIRETWVFAAPPSFVARPSGKIFVIGIAPDQDTFLPRTLSDRIKAVGTTRLIVPKFDEDLTEELCTYGLQKLSMNSWLKEPKLQSPDELLDEMRSRLSLQPVCGEINGLRIIDIAKPVTYYRARWSDPMRHTGLFVARRPQAFGNPLWCFVELKDGEPIRILDLPPTTSRWRGCDIAWHVQMALDYSAGHLQGYRREEQEEGVRLDFLSPLPQWAERRLMTIGKSVPRDHSVVAYIIPREEAETEERFIQHRLWLEPIYDSA